MPRVKPSTRASIGEVDIKPDITQLYHQRAARSTRRRSSLAAPGPNLVDVGVAIGIGVNVKMEMEIDVDNKPVVPPSGPVASDGVESSNQAMAGSSTQTVARPKKARKTTTARTQSRQQVVGSIAQGRSEADKILDKLLATTGDGGIITGEAVREAFSNQTMVKKEKARKGKQPGAMDSSTLACGSGCGSSGSPAMDHVPSTAAVKIEVRGKGKARAEPIPRRPVMWRKTCPKSTMDRFDRVMSQRMFLLDRSGPSPRNEDFKILGSTGNVYTVTLGNTPLCDCPDAGKGNIPCKHIIFVFMKVLKVHPSSELWYQKHLLDEEVESVFATAPPAVQGAYEVPARARAAYLKASGRESEIPLTDREPEPHPELETEAGVTKRNKSENLNRKDPIGEDCPVCFEEMEQGDIDKNLLVWDDGLYGCGKALHAECWKNWVISREGIGAEIKCVWCRSTWPTAPPTAGGPKNGAGVTSGGYLNIGDLVGVSRKRDTSSYYWGPMRGRRMNDPRYEDE